MFQVFPGQNFGFGKMADRKLKVLIENFFLIVLKLVRSSEPEKVEHPGDEKLFKLEILLKNIRRVQTKTSKIKTPIRESKTKEK